MRWVVWIIGVLMLTGQLLAQEVEIKSPPGALQDKSSGIQWLIMSIFLVATLVVAFKPAKRSKLE